MTESQTIFASDGRFLNDTEELVHARQIVEELAEQEIEKIEGSLEWKDTNLPPVIAETLRRTVRSLFGGRFSDEFLQVFVACFSESRDQLSQWRGYSHGSTGVSLGYDLRNVRSTLYSGLAAFAPCVYNDGKKRELLRDVVQNLFERTIALMTLTYRAGYDVGLKSASDEESEASFQNWYENNADVIAIQEKIDVYRRDAAYSLLHIAALMKNASFREECEWRLVLPRLRSFNDHKLQTDFRTGSSTLIPHIAHGLPSDSLPLKEVILGPDSHNAAEGAITAYLASRDLEAKVTRSCIPYRSSRN